MDYAAIYSRLMERSRGRIREGYMERHHVVPRCMGGSNEKENLVLLTAKEHFIAHKLLVRMFPQVRGLWLALVAMGRLLEYKAKIYASERAQAANARRGFRYTPEARAKMSESARKRGRNSEGTEFKPGLTTWNKGLPKELSHRYGKKHSLETLEKMRQSQQSHKEAQSERMKQWWADRKASKETQGASS